VLVLHATQTALFLVVPRILEAGGLPRHLQRNQQEKLMASVNKVILVGNLASAATISRPASNCKVYLSPIVAEKMKKSICFTRRKHDIVMVGHGIKVSFGGNKTRRVAGDRSGRAGAAQRRTAAFEFRRARAACHANRVVTSGAVRSD
jgi:hypothetical protein